LTPAHRLSHVNGYFIGGYPITQSSLIHFPLPLPCLTLRQEALMIKGRDIGDP
jgi:hypothetical protein